MSPNKTISYTVSIRFIEFVGEWQARPNMPGNTLVDDDARGWGDTPGAAVSDMFSEKQTIRPVPDSLLDKKNQQGEYSMKTLAFDYAAYGVSGEPEHDTSGVPCWCGAVADGDGVVVHKDMVEILSGARFLGQGEAADDLAVTRAALAQARALLSEVAGKYHEVATGHDPENFRGCTHRECVELRAQLAALLGQGGAR